MKSFNSIKCFYFLFLVILETFYNPANCEYYDINITNLDSIINSHELVLLNFGAEWCDFSTMLAPIYREAAEQLKVIYPEPGKVAFGRMICDYYNKEKYAESFSICWQRYKVGKYPTFLVFRHSRRATKEFRGSRSVIDFIEFVRKEFEDPVVVLRNLTDLEYLNDKKRSIVGYFENEKDIDYQIFRRLADHFKNNCHFYAGFGDNRILNLKQPDKPHIVFKPDVALTHDQEVTFDGDARNFYELDSFIQNKCFPLVREITFSNAEEIVEEGLPLLILFHHPDDLHSMKDYKAIVNWLLKDERDRMNFLVADGRKFNYPMRYFDKTEEDLPLIIIDSLSHMYMFPNYSEILDIERKPLKNFTNDYFSGKLHWNYHHGSTVTEEKVTEATVTEATATEATNTNGTNSEVTQATNSEATNSEATNSEATNAEVKSSDERNSDETNSDTTNNSNNTGTKHPQSVFKNFGPSKNRYSLEKEEL